MKTSIRNIILAATLALAGTAQVGTVQAAEIIPNELKPLQAHTVALGDYTAVVFFTVLANGKFQVITSAGPNEGIEGEMIQQVELVKPGETVIYSLTTAEGKPATEFHFTAGQDRLIVASR